MWDRDVDAWPGIISLMSDIGGEPYAHYGVRFLVVTKDLGEES